MPVIIFFQLLSYSLGISSLVVSIMLFQKKRDKTLRYYIVFLFIFTVRLSFNMILFYTRANIYALNSTVLFSLLVIYQISVDITYLMALCFPIILHNLFSVKFRKPADILLVITGSAVIAVEFYPYLFAWKRHIAYYPVKEINFIFSIIVVMVYLYSIFLFGINRKKMNDKEQKNLVFSIFAFFITFILFDYMTAKNTFILYNAGEQTLLLLNFLFYTFWNVYFLLFTAVNWKNSSPDGILDEISGEFLGKYGITERESEIIKMILNGKSNPGIARELFISLKTVKNHVYNIFHKTGIKSRMELSFLIRRESKKEK